MSGPQSAQPAGSGLDLRAVRVHPTWGDAEHRRWDREFATHHYLSFQRMFGKGLRQVARFRGTWVALLGWQPGALKVGVRDRWIGWSPQQKLRRLHLIAQNVRFLILSGWNRPNLASRVLGLSLRRLSSAILAIHGYPILLAESFLDPERFRGSS